MSWTERGRMVSAPSATKRPIPGRSSDSRHAALKPRLLAASIALDFTRAACCQKWRKAAMAEKWFEVSIRGFLQLSPPDGTEMLEDRRIEASDTAAGPSRNLTEVPCSREDRDRSLATPSIVATGVSPCRVALSRNKALAVKSEFCVDSAQALQSAWPIYP